MSYDNWLTLSVPLSEATSASKIGKAFDPDVGGEFSFTEIEGELVCSTPCTTAFKQQALALMQDANALHQACLADYASRWPELTPPTLAECDGFIAEIVGT
jgi:hypothetical protein